jgi:hypothetical protein
MACEETYSLPSVALSLSFLRVYLRVEILLRLILRRAVRHCPDGGLPCFDVAFDRFGSARMATALPNRRFEFHKSRQLFIRVHNITLPVATMRISNPDRLSGRINS